MRYLIHTAMLGAFAFLVSCSSGNDLINCPPLSAPIEGARAFVLTDEFKQIVDVRLNGVRAQCAVSSDGGVLMEIKAGMKMTRDLTQNAEADIAVVPMITAVLDANDNVLSNNSFSYKNGFDTDLNRLLPVAEFELVVPMDGRVVISLTPNY